MIRVRDAAEAVAFYRGERAERERLDTPVRRRHRQLPALRPPDTCASSAGTTRSPRQSRPLPFLVQAPRLFAGAIKFGDVTQSGTAFGKIESGLSFFRNAYSQFASYNAAIIRLHGLLEANDASRASSRR